ncbi:hypothetical protein KDA14_02670 [Candidatus Saccharibacteria bacterium]|nr:hypothetical protein [Candidatus Saccharibacteria bacterium]
MIRKLLSLSLAVAVLGVATVSVAPAQKASAAASKTTTTTTTKTTAKDPYAYTAKSGDSYTVLARKAVQTYGIREKVKLSLAQIVAAETFLTSNAGFPELNEGQSVTFNKDDVKAAVKQAQGLSDSQKAAWQAYVPYVDFDTRDNG